MITSRAEYETLLARAELAAAIDSVPADKLDRPGSRNGPLCQLWQASKPVWTDQHTQLVRYRLNAARTQG
jgi:hypothetical protein